MLFRPASSSLRKSVSCEDQTKPNLPPATATKENPGKSGGENAGKDCVELRGKRAEASRQDEVRLTSYNIMNFMVQYVQEVLSSFIYVHCVKMDLLGHRVGSIKQC